ncbi:hypothetical protein ACJX0J_017222, partial [Zea mays]
TRCPDFLHKNNGLISLYYKLYVLMTENNLDPWVTRQSSHKIKKYYIFRIDVPILNVRYILLLENGILPKTVLLINFTSNFLANYLLALSISRMFLEIMVAGVRY